MFTNLAFEELETCLLTLPHFYLYVKSATVPKAEFSGLTLEYLELQ
jgi:hypothetical protein